MRRRAGAAIAAALFCAVPADAFAAGGAWEAFWRDWRMPVFYIAFAPLLILCLAGVGWRWHWRRLRAGEYNRQLGAGLLFLALSVIFTWPLAARCRAEIINWGDTLLLAYILRHHLELWAGPWTNYFDAPIFYPLTANALARSEHIFGAFWMLSPVLLATRNTVLAINLLALTSFAACGWCIYLYLRANLKDEAAALLGGLLFGFCAFRTAHLARPQLLSCQFLPLCLLFFERYARGRRPAELWRFTLACALQMLLGGYWIVFMAYALGACCLALWLGHGLWRDRRCWVRLSAAAVWLALIQYPLLQPYAALSREVGDPWTQAQTREIAAKGSHYFCAPHVNRVYGAITRAHERALPGIEEGYLFCGLIALGLVMLGGWTRLAGAPRYRGAGRNRRLLLADAGLMLLGLLLLYPLLTNDFYLGLWGDFVFHFPRLKILLSLCFLAAAGRIALAVYWARREETAAYEFNACDWLFAALILISFLFTFGPVIDLGHHVWRNPIYQFAHDYLPGIALLRSPARAFFLLLLFGAWFAAAGWLRLAAAIAPGWPRIAAAVLTGLLMFAEGAPAPSFWNYHPPELPQTLAVAELPSGYARLRGLWNEPAVVMLPMNEFWYDIHYMHGQQVHGLTLANGYSGLMPADYEEFRRAMGTFPAEPALAAMRGRGVRVAVLHRALVAPERWADWTARLGGAADFETLYQDAEIRAVRWNGD